MNASISPAPQSSTTGDRQYYIDWLRAGAMFLLVFYHSGRLFDEPNWHIKAATSTFGIEVFNRILDVWHMPLFFFLAGMSVWYSLGSRSPGGFSKERLLRIFIPLLFGVLIIVPPQVYVERIFSGDFTGSFFAWYPHTFQGVYSVGNAATGNFSWHHLWFLAYLFVFSLLLIPLFFYLRHENRQRFITRLTGFMKKPGVLYLPVIPLAIYNIWLLPIFGSGNQNLISDWRNVLFYITVFFIGFFFISDPRITRLFRRDRYVGLGLALVTTVFLFAVETDAIIIPEAIKLGLYGGDTWFWLVTVVGFGMRYLNVENKLRRYTVGAILPVYILHQTIIVVVGYFVLRAEWSNLPAYFFVVAVTFITAVVIYELVRRTGFTRFLFGIKASGSRRIAD